LRSTRVCELRLIGCLNPLRGRVRKGTHAPAEFVSLEHILHDMRLVKSRAEVAAMRRAARISAAAHKRAMRACRPGMKEYEVEAELLHDFHRHGGEPAYTSIVGGGANACVLHYVDNDAPLGDGDLLLIDAGVELDGYASDITRTFPVNGRYSPEQRALYEVVLKAQLAAIDQVRAGRHWNDPHDAAVRELTQGLVRLGLLKGTVSKLIREEKYRKFYMHRTGHWIGMDVHDVGDYKVDDQWRALEPGMALTIEPGLYVAPGTRGVPKRFQGIGIRIEDDVLVTRGDPDVLSADVPKDPDEIEALMRA
jgi:Xaa-Pro aminopeptidase